MGITTILHRFKSKIMTVVDDTCQEIALLTTLIRKRAWQGRRSVSWTVGRRALLMICKAQPPCEKAHMPPIYTILNNSLHLLNKTYGIMFVVGSGEVSPQSQRHLCHTHVTILCASVFVNEIGTLLSDFLFCTISCSVHIMYCEG